MIKEKLIMVRAQLPHFGYSDTQIDSWALNLPDREYASKWTILVGDFETYTIS